MQSRNAVAWALIAQKLCPRSQLGFKQSVGSLNFVSNMVLRPLLQHAHHWPQQTAEGLRTPLDKWKWSIKANCYFCLLNVSLSPSFPAWYGSLTNKIQDVLQGWQYEVFHMLQKNRQNKCLAIMTQQFSGQFFSLELASSVVAAILFN